jgi:hypothetical protein
MPDAGDEAASPAAAAPTPVPALLLLPEAPAAAAAVGRLRVILKDDMSLLLLMRDHRRERGLRVTAGTRRVVARGGDAQAEGSPRGGGDAGLKGRAGWPLPT